MKTSFNGLLSLIGAILVFTTVSVCFSNCSSEDDFGEMEEMIATMAEKKMTRATEDVKPSVPDQDGPGSQEYTFSVATGLTVYINVQWSAGDNSGAYNSGIITSTHEVWDYQNPAVQNKWHKISNINIQGKWITDSNIEMKCYYNLKQFIRRNDSIITKDLGVQSDQRTLFIK